MTSDRKVLPSADELLETLRGLLAQRGIASVDRDTELVDIGLDSMAIAEIVLRVRNQYVDDDGDIDVPDGLLGFVTVDDIIAIMMYLIEPEVAGD